MIRILVYSAIVFILTVFCLLQIHTSSEDFGVADYLNILLINKESYTFYDISDTTFVNQINIFIVLGCGILIATTSIEAHSRGFRAMQIIRFQENGYFLQMQRDVFQQTLMFLGLWALVIVAGLLIVDPRAFTTLSQLTAFSSLELIIGIMCYLIKMMITFMFLGLLIGYLVLFAKYEFLILLGVLLSAILLTFDVYSPTTFVSLNLSLKQFLYLSILILFYCISFWFVKRCYRLKESW